MNNLNWIYGNLKEEFYGEKKRIYELENKDLLIKRLLTNTSVEQQVSKYRSLRQKIGSHLPETSFVRACDNHEKEFTWTIQEKLDGRWLETILNPKEEIFGRAWSQYREIIRKCPEVNSSYYNFLWDDFRKRLFYVGS
jgi:hypothetical protein